MEYVPFRPIEVEFHPLSLRTYILPTPAIDSFYERVKRNIKLRVPGAIIYSLPRYGKSSAITYCRSMLKEDYPGVPVFDFSCEKKLSRSESGFFFHILESIPHKLSSAGNVNDKRSRLTRFLYEKAKASRYNLVIFFIDEAQFLWTYEYEWLRNIHDELERRGVKMITFLVGQHQLITQKRQLMSVSEVQIVMRLMTEELQFRGLLSVDDVATCLNGYDESCYPDNSDWCYTRFFFPKAYNYGFRMADQARTVWNTFSAAHTAANFSREVEIPMQYFSRAVEIALLDNMVNDSADFSLSQKNWSDAVLESKFIQGQEDLTFMKAFD